MPAVGLIGIQNTPSRFPSAVLHERNFVLAGVTKDSLGVALGSCTVRLFNAATHVAEQVTTSDASGNFSLTVDKTQRYYLVIYKVGSPDVTGASINTLAGL